MVGLGNPGARYAATRHNIGLRVLDRFGRRHGIPLVTHRYFGLYGGGSVGDLSVGLLAPQTFMNRSGQAVQAALAELAALDPASDLLVVYDDLDLPLGRIRLRSAGGAGGHRGMADIIERLERRDFARLRFGIGHPAPESDVIDYVLSPFPADQAEYLAERIAAAAEAIETALLEGVEVAMDRFNREPSPKPEPPERR